VVGRNLAEAGWRPVDAALFGAMLGLTDAVAVTAILKAGRQAAATHRVVRIKGPWLRMAESAMGWLGST
jgi:hypothetical protein